MTARPVLLDELPSRDLYVLHDLKRVRALTGYQLERLHFHDLNTPHTKGSARRRSLHRLQDQSLITTLARRVGGERAGSAGLIYSLDGAGHRLLDALDYHGQRRRRPWSVGQQFVAHTLAISELYVRLREAERRGDLHLLTFDAEPTSWHHSALGCIKPDAYTVVAAGRWEDHTWIEVDRGTESLPTLRRKLLAYVDLATAGNSGPGGVLPQVLVTVETPKRRVALTELIFDLPSPAGELIRVQPFQLTYQNGLDAFEENRGPP